MHILVTGQKGYIGTVLVPMLMEAGHDVHGMDTDLYRDCGFGDPGTDVPSREKDIRDIALSDLEGFQGVVHLAGLSNDPLGNLDPQLTRNINHHASVRLATTGQSSPVTPWRTRRQVSTGHMDEAIFLGAR